MQPFVLNYTKKNARYGVPTIHTKTKLELEINECENHLKLMNTMLTRATTKENIKYYKDCVKYTQKAIERLKAQL